MYTCYECELHQRCENKVAANPHRFPTCNIENKCDSFNLMKNCDRDYSPSYVYPDGSLTALGMRMMVAMGGVKVNGKADISLAAMSDERLEELAREIREKQIVEED